MRSLATTQDSLAGAAFNPFTAVPVRARKTSRSKSGPDARNDIGLRLIDALAARYPVINRLVGEESFRTVAYQYLLKEPPSAAMPQVFGATFPAFLRNIRQGASTEYLADIADLECAVAAAHHAAEARPVHASALSTLAPDRFDRFRMTLHPSLHLVASRFPVITIWGANRGGNGVIECWGAEAALVARPFFDVEVRRLLPGGLAFLRCLARDETLTEAIEA